MNVIKLFDNYISIVTEKDGIITEKECAPEQLLNLLLSSTSTGLSSGLLPKNCLEVDLSPGMKKIFMSFEKGIFDIKCYDTIYQIEMPDCIFVFLIDINASRIKKSYLVSVKTDKIREDTLIYHYPLSNVSTSNLSMCWGSNVLPSITSLNQLQGIPYLFFKSELNHDWYSGNNTSKLPLRDLMVSLHKKEINIYDILKPTGMTYKQFVESIGDSNGY